jgi:hypothetical protein
MTQMTKQWKNEAGYTITLTHTSRRRSRIDVRDQMGASLLYHEFDYWQQAQAEREAEALALLSHAMETPRAA